MIDTMMSMAVFSSPCPMSQEVDQTGSKKEEEIFEEEEAELPELWLGDVGHSDLRFNPHVYPLVH